MTCYHPNKMFVVGVQPNGKKHLVFTSGTDCQGVWSIDPRSNKWNKIYCDPDQVINWSKSRPWDDYLYIDNSVLGDPRWFGFDYVEVPCGQCAGCRVDRSRQWADRMLLECEYHENNCFITLTYDDAHVPTSSYIDRNDHVRDSLTLRKRDFQLFVKRLRRRVEYAGGDPFRFYACGEYGSTTYRPHYHAILFGYFPEDAVLHHVTPRGDAFYTSETISAAWQNQGFILVSRVSWDTCAYTARYCTKKLTGDGAGLYSYMNVEPPFSLMSRRPGLARQFYEDHKDDIYQLDKIPNIYVSTPHGGKKMRSPRYFDTLFDIEYPETSEKIRAACQRMASANMIRKLKQTDLDKWQLLKIDERYFGAKIKVLKRDQV